MKKRNPAATGTKTKAQGVETGDKAGGSDAGGTQFTDEEGILTPRHYFRESLKQLDQLEESAKKQRREKKNLEFYHLKLNYL